jgi:hypothetical protein
MWSRFMKRLLPLALLLPACAATPGAADGGRAPENEDAGGPADAPAGVDVDRGDTAGACLAMTFAIDPVPQQDSVWMVTVGDLDGDGKLDVLMKTTQVTVLLGDGQGHVAAAGTVTGLEADGQPALADIDEDGRLDIVAPRSAGAVAGSPLGVDVYRNQGGGRFGAALSSLTAAQISTVALARIDGDAHLDLVFVGVVGSGSPAMETHLYVAPGNGDGTFGAPVDLGATGFSPALAILDVDGDGRDDVVAGLGPPDQTSGLATNGAGVWLNDGSLSMSKGPVITLPSAPQSFATGDVDGDGKRDVVASADQIYVLRGGGGSFRLAVPAPVYNDRSTSIAVGDVDHDGRDDVAVVNGIDVGFATVAHATAQGIFDDEFRFYIGRQPTFIASGDMDGDGVPDLVAATRDSQDIVILLARPRPTGAADEHSCAPCLPQQVSADQCQELM